MHSTSSSLWSLCLSASVLARFLKFSFIHPCYITGIFISNYFYVQIVQETPGFAVCAYSDQC